MTQDKPKPPRIDYCECKVKDVNRASICNYCRKPVRVGSPPKK